MLYGRIQVEGDLVVHTVFNLPQEKSADVTDKVFRDNEILGAATALGAHPKYIRSMARAGYTSYPSDMPPTNLSGYSTNVEDELSHYLNAVKLDGNIEHTTKDIRGFCTDFMRCIEDYRRQREVFEKSSAVHKRDCSVRSGLLATAQGYKAVLLQRYISYLLSALTHAARVAVMRTIPLLLEEREKEKQWRVVVNRALLDPILFREAIEEELQRRPIL